MVLITCTKFYGLQGSPHCNNNTENRKRYVNFNIKINQGLSGNSRVQDNLSYSSKKKLYNEFCKILSILLWIFVLIFALEYCLTRVERYSCIKLLHFIFKFVRTSKCFNFYPPNNPNFHLLICIFVHIRKSPKEKWRLTLTNCILILNVFIHEIKLSFLSWLSAAENIILLLFSRKMHFSWLDERKRAMGGWSMDMKRKWSERREPE